MMRSKIRFYQNPWYTPATYDENLMKRKRTTRMEMGVLIKTLGLVEGYWRWILVPILIGLCLSTLNLLWPWLERMIVDECVPTQNWDMYWTIAITLILVYVTRQLVLHCNTVLGNFLNGRMGLWLQIQYYRHLQRIPMTYVERKGVGDHMYRMHSDTVSVLAMVTGVIHQVINEVYSFILSIVFIAVIDIRLMYIIIPYEIFYLISAQWMITLQRKLEFYARAAKASTDSRMQEGLHGVQTVKVFGRLHAEVGDFVHRVAIQLRVQSVVMWLRQMITWVFRGSGFFPHFKEFTIYGFLYFEIINGRMTYGTIIPVMAYLKLFENPVEKIVDLWQFIRMRLVYAERIYQILDVKPSVVDRPDAQRVPRLQGDVEARDVHFEYENGVEVLHGVNMAVGPGQFAALVGPSGSGKSTMMGLYLRLYDPTSGEIRVDGVNLLDYRQNEYRRQLGVVMQETFLSKETLRWNLMLSRYNATEEEMLAALEQCRLMDWYGKLPNGLDSLLNEGTRVSVGEKQRLGVARALLRSSNIMLLDEPTSSLDLDTEAEVMDVIHGVRKGKTTLMVTHRLNTIAGADVIFAMDRGTIVETGTHEQLVQQGGFYHNLVKMFYATQRVGS